MRRLLLAALAAFALGAPAAPAATYTANVTATTYGGNVNQGLRVRTLNLAGNGNWSGATIGVTLDAIGDSVTLDLFRLAANDPGLDPDDLIARPASVTFAFGAGTVTLFGATQGLTAPGRAFASFLEDAIDVGGGLRILIALADTTFATDGTSYVNGASGAAVLRATFTLAAVPLPAAGGLVPAGLGLLVLAGRRRRRAA